MNLNISNQFALADAIKGARVWNRAAIREVRAMRVTSDFSGPDVEEYRRIAAERIALARSVRDTCIATARAILGGN